MNIQKLKNGKIPVTISREQMSREQCSTYNTGRMVRCIACNRVVDRYAVAAIDNPANRIEQVIKCGNNSTVSAMLVLCQECSDAVNHTLAQLKEESEIKIK